MDLLNEIQRVRPLAIKGVRYTETTTITASGDKLDFTTITTIHFKIQHLSWDCDMVTVPNLAVPLILVCNFLFVS